MRKNISPSAIPFFVFVLTCLVFQSSYAFVRSCLDVLSEKTYAPIRRSSEYHGAIDFEQITVPQLRTAILRGLEAAEANLKAIIENPEEPTYKNTIDALETLGDSMEIARAAFDNFQSVKINPEIQLLEAEIDPLISKFYAGIPFNSALFKRVEALYNQRNRLNLPLEEKTILIGTYQQFASNGARLSKPLQDRLLAISERHTELANSFKNNLVKAITSYELLITDAGRLDGMPEQALKTARNSAQSKGHAQGWLFTLSVASRIEILKHAKDRSFREEIWRASSRMGTIEGADNRPVLLEISKLRLERARILGFNTHADYVLKNRMAGSLKTVNEFLDKLAGAYKLRAKEDLTQLEAFAGMQLKPWDLFFYIERMQEKEFKFQSEELRPYFAFDKVLQGAFSVAKKLYGVTFIPRNDLPVWDPSVQAFEVRDRNGKYLALFYVDPYERATKRPNAAWMNSILAAGIVDGVYRRPHVINATNFSPPTADRPSLISAMDVTTVFHELGHGLHGMLTKIRNRSISGAATEWDAVELPSQLFEKWAFRPEVLATYAHHWQTGDALPTDLLEKFKQSQNFMVGIPGLRQIMLGKLDLAWTGSDISQVKVDDVEAWEARTMAPYMITERLGFTQAASFSHIFSLGYAAGYYGYKWADVLAADAFGVFENNGIFDPKTSSLFRKYILETGQRRSAAQNYFRFRGRAPDSDALLKSEGIDPNRK